MPGGGKNLEPCRLREARTKKFQPWNVGFPRGDELGTPLLPSTGTAHVQLVAVEFPNSLGTSAELVAADAQISEFNRWFAFHSRGNLKFSWQFPKTWFRMSKPASEYRYDKGSPTTFIPMMSEIVAISDPVIDYSKSDFVFVLFPRNVSGLSDDGIGWANFEIMSAEGPVKNLFGGGQYFYRNNFDLWSYWVHEYGHPMGLPGHSPRSRISVMDDQNGASVVLNAWDSFHAGWMDTSELYCMPLGRRALSMQLIPLERLEYGPRAVIAPISDTNAVVVESHRPEGWGQRMGRGVSGISVYWIDTTFDTDRYAGSSGFIDTDKGDRWSDHLVPPGKTRQFDLLKVGDVVRYRGITVSYVSGGRYDRIRVTRGDDARSTR